MSSFGKRLQEVRENHGWSIQDLADRSGVPYITIYRTEKGIHKEPRIGIAVQLAKALGVPVELLAGAYDDVLRQEKQEEKSPDNERMPALAL
jgi:transcriptional regulator with XRE-family HTH domain